MARKIYTIEREGQIDFFDNYGIPYENDNSVLIDNTDGVWNGLIYEFKLEINNINKALFQAIKYLSRMRIKGESVPATILLIDLNGHKAYKFSSSDYKDEIQKVYVGAASKFNEGFIAKKEYVTIDYSNIIGSNQIKKLLTSKKSLSEMYIPIDIDETCIVGWGTRYYNELPTASKGDFLGVDDKGVVKVVGEIREPKHFKGLINPYTGKTNEKFKYLMDMLNSRLQKKDLGAFYTPMEYAKKAAELVKMAVDRVPEGNDYIILDRCAGTGNLEEGLVGIKDRNGDELISHCIVSTYEYYEYKVLNERIGDLVRDIIPPTEADVIYENGKVSNADAMSEDYINNPIIREYINDPKYTIILYENPPYRDVTSNSTGVAKAQDSFVLDEMKKEISGPILNELTNRFIWSGYKYYLRQPTDSYVLFSPVKYFKTCGLSNKKFVKGYLFNRAHFHASPSAIACILWENIDEIYDNIELPAYNLDMDGNLRFEANRNIKKAYKPFSKGLYDKRKFIEDTEDGVCCNLDGTEHISEKGVRVKKIYNSNILGYIRASSFNFDALSKQLLRCGEYDANGFFVRDDNYMDKLPLWVAKNIPLERWYDKDIYATTADAKDIYIKDKEFLKSCFIYACLSNQNKCLSFIGSDGRYYKNELCFDKDTIASKEISNIKFDTDEQKLIDLWYKILDKARSTGKCNDNWTYGVYQITKEINTSYKEGTGKNERTIYDYPELNGDLETLRTLLKKYYKSHITDKMFKYELIK